MKGLPDRLIRLLMCVCVFVGDTYDRCNSDAQAQHKHDGYYKGQDWIGHCDATVCGLG